MLSNPIIFSILFLFIFTIFIVTLNSFITRFYIRRRLKKGLNEHKVRLQQAKGDYAQLLGMYKRIYNAALYKPNRFFSKNKARYEDKVNTELNRLVKNPFTRIFSNVRSAIKGFSAFFLLLASVFFGSIAVDEFKASSLKLPTIDPDMELSVNVDVKDEFEQLFSYIFPTHQLQRFDLPVLTEEDVEPYYPLYDYPESVTNTEQAIASHMSSFENNFVIYYEGDPSNLNQDLENAYTWLDQNEPYLWAIRGESSMYSLDYGSYIELEITMNYDLTAEQNALVHGSIKQLVRTLDPELTEADKVKFVNDYLVTQTKYNAQSQAHPHTPYAILLHGEGVCEGYALAAYLMLEELGVEAKYVVGDAGGPHAWNLVKVDNEWYHLDVTWNDPIPDQGKNVRYDYFLISDETISNDHSWDTSVYPSSYTEDYL